MGLLARLQVQTAPAAMQAADAQPFDDLMATRRAQMQHDQMVAAAHEAAMDDLIRRLHAMPPMRNDVPRPGGPKWAVPRLGPQRAPNDRTPTEPDYNRLDRYGE